MKTDAYESLVDGLVEMSVIFIWYLLLLAAAIIIIGIVLAVINVSLLPETIPAGTLMWYYVTPSAVIITIPITLVIYYLRKAVKLYKDCFKNLRLRDFWMGYATKVQLVKNVNGDEVEKWINENVSHMHTSYNDYIYLFASTEDATAFKLRWYE